MPPEAPWETGDARPTSLDSHQLPLSTQPCGGRASWLWGTSSNHAVNQACRDMTGEQQPLTVPRSLALDVGTSDRQTQLACPCGRGCSQSAQALQCQTQGDALTLRPQHLRIPECCPGEEAGGTSHPTAHIIVWGEGTQSTKLFLGRWLGRG